MGVDVDACTFGLLEQLFKELEVVAGNQNAFARLGPQLDRSWNRVAVSFNMGLVEQLHGDIVDATGFHGQADVRHQVEAVVEHCGQGLVSVSVDLIRFFAEDAGMVSIGCVAFDAIHDDLTNRVNVSVDGVVFDSMQLA